MKHKHGGDVYSQPYKLDFSANINYRGMPEAVREGALRAIEDCVHYPDPRYRRLREILAAKEGVRWNEIICGNGAAELMFAFTQALRPRKALVAVPSFYEYEQALQAAQCEKTERYLLRPEEMFDPDERFLEKIDPSTDLVILGNPNNPTGRKLSTEFLKKLSDTCKRMNCYLLLDESFLDFLCEKDREETLSGVSLLEENPKIFILKSFTKMYAMPGLRFGYGICRSQELPDRMHALLQPWNVSLPAQEAAAAAAGEQIFAQESARLTAENRCLMKKWMEEAGFSVWEGTANFLLFQSLPGLEAVCARKGMLIRDCSNFPGLSEGWYRICIRSREENRELLECLKEAGEELQTRISQEDAEKEELQIRISQEDAGEKRKTRIPERNSERKAAVWQK